MGCCLFTTDKKSQKLKYNINTCSFNCPCALLMHFNCKEKQKVQFPTTKSYVPHSTNNCSADRVLDTSRSLIGVYNTSHYCKKYINNTATNHWTKTANYCYIYVDKPSFQKYGLLPLHTNRCHYTGILICCCLRFVVVVEFRCGILYLE